MFTVVQPRDLFKVPGHQAYHGEVRSKRASDSKEYVLRRHSL
jgi:hypothetical protein